MVTVYGLTASKEQQKHIRICNCIRCFESLYRLSGVDSGGKRVPFFDKCVDCPDVTLCRPFRQAADKVNNGG